jgi:hypothetical protein
VDEGFVTVFVVVRGTEAREDDEAVNECTEAQLVRRRRDDFNRFILLQMMLLPEIF